jgi:hypothetical protein
VAPASRCPVRPAARAPDSALTGRKALPLRAESRRRAAPEEEAAAVRRSWRAAAQPLEAEAEAEEPEAEEEELARPSVAR